MSKKSVKRRSIVSKDLTEIKNVVKSAENTVELKENVIPVKDFAPEIANKISSNSSDERFVIKVGNDKWLESWVNFSLCENKEDAMVLNHDWAIGHKSRLSDIKNLKAEIVKL